MSLWKFGGLEAEIDLTDADFMERLEEAQRQLEYSSKNTLKVGKKSEIIRSQCACFDAFFNTLFGENASELMYEGRNSLELRIQSADAFFEFGKKEDRRIDGAYSKYYVKTAGNRQQKKNYNNNQAQHSAR